MSTQNRACLTLLEAAEELRVSRSKIYELINAGELKAIRVGERLRIRRYDLDRYLQLAPATSAKAKAV